MLEAIADPKHERHAELTEWIDDDFDPHGGQAEWLAAEVDALARKWSRKPAGKRSRRKTGECISVCVARRWMGHNPAARLEDVVKLLELALGVAKMLDHVVRENTVKLRRGRSPISERQSVTLTASSAAARSPSSAACIGSTARHASIVVRMSSIGIPALRIATLANSAKRLQQ